MLRYLNLLIPLTLYFTTTKSTFVSHTNNLPTQVSDSSNVVTLDILDDTAFDMRYQTNCTDCKCFVQTPVLTYQKQADAPLTGPTILSSLSAGKLFIAQSSSYSIYQISPPNTLFESVLDASLQELSGYPNITFSVHDNALAGYNNGWLGVATIDSQGGVQITTYTYSYPSGVTQSSEVYDLVYSGSKFFLAKGDQGLEILTVQAQTQTDMVRLSLDDLEVEQGFEARKLAVDSDNQVLYLYHPDSNYSTVVALDFSTPSQISLIGNYELGVTQIKQVLVSENKLHVVNKNDNGTYNYIEFLRNTEDIYDEPEMIKFWQISEEILNIQLLDDDNVLIETSDYLYVIRNDLPFETEISQLLINIIHKQGTGIFTVFQGTSIYVLNIDNDNLLLNLYSAPFENPSLKCGIYKQDGGDYTGTVPFTVDIYRDSCDDAPTKSDDNICLDHYVFDADFNGNTVIPFETDLFSLAPTPVSLSTSTPETEVPEEPETTEPSTGGEQPTGPVETPETPTNTTEPTTEPSTGGEGGSTGPGSSEPAPGSSTNTTETGEPSTGTSGEGHNNEGPNEGPDEETPETPTNTTETGTTTGPSTPETPANNTGTGGSTGPTKAPADTNEPVDSSSNANNQTETNKTSSSNENGGLIKKPDLIDPDAPYYDKIDNMYILVVLGLIVVTCFGCVVKCLWDFVTRSRRRIAQQFEHKELEEEEDGEGDQDVEQGSKYKSKGTDEESVSQGE